VCENLVSTNRHIINTSPSIVSSIMQYFGSARMTNSSSRRNGGQFSDSSQDIALQNFAPLGVYAMTVDRYCSDCLFSSAVFYCPFSRMPFMLTSDE
jgi:hypothetical protein